MSYYRGYSDSYDHDNAPTLAEYEAEYGCYRCGERPAPEDDAVSPNVCDCCPDCNGEGIQRHPEGHQDCASCGRTGSRRERAKFLALLVSP